MNSSINFEKNQSNIKYEDSSVQRDFTSADVKERQKKLLEIRDKLKAKDSDKVSTTPRSKELINELEHFRPRTSHNFRPDF